MRKILIAFSNEGVTLKFRKDPFLKEPVGYLGQVARRRRLKIDSRPRVAIREKKTSTNLAELQFLLKACNGYRRFVSTFARLIARLGRKLENSQLVSLGPLNEKKLRSTESLKLCSPPHPCSQYQTVIKL